jgi:hypothetical protein
MFIAENNAARAILNLPAAQPKVMKRALIPKPKPKPAAKSEGSKPVQYRACREVGFSPKWRVEPVNYVGRGVVYIFDTEAEAIEKANAKNKEATKRK